MKIKDGIIFGIIFASVLIASRDLFKSGYFPIHDDLQVGRLYEIDSCFKDSQFPCRWVPDMGYGYGYPLFNYYPPLPYFFGELVHKLGFSFIDSTKIMFLGAILISAILMYLFGKSLWGQWGGVLSSVLYIFAPYHAVDIYVRGAMNEAWAIAFLPGVCWAVYEIIDHRDKKYVPVMAIMFAMLLLSHNLMAFIFTPVIAFFALLMIWLRKKNFKEKILKLVLGGLWGFGLAAFFTLPVIVEKKYAHVETMLMGYFNYLAHFVSIKKLLFTRFWGYGSSGWLQETGMPFQVGIFHWVLAVFVFLGSVFFFLKRKISKEYLILNTCFLILFIFSLFLVHLRSVFIWNAVPILAYLQFPWRFLTLVVFSISILGGGIVFFFKSERWKVIVTTVLLLITVWLNYSFFRFEKIFPMTDQEKLFSAKGWNKLQTDAIFDYLPIYAKVPPGGPAPEKPEIIEGFGEISGVEKGSNWYRFSINVGNKAKVQIPEYDFPGWKVWVDNKLTQIYHDNSLGLITIFISPGSHTVKLKLTDTPVRTVGNVISLFSWILVFWLLVRRKLASR